MNETMKRLYEVAKEIKGVETQSQLALLLNESPQVVKNWEYRGVSKAGMLAASKVIGCTTTYLQTGLGAKYTNRASQSKLIQEVINLMESCDSRGQEKIFMAARDAYELHQAHKMRLDAEIQRVSDVNKTMSSDEPAAYGAATPPPAVRQ